MSAIEIEGLDFTYNEQNVLSKISLAVQEGEFLGIIGPNGGGKTTLLKLLLGFFRPELGRIEVFGKSPKEMQFLMGYVPQSFHFDKIFPLTVLDLVLQGLLRELPWYGRFRKKEIEKAKEALKRVGLAGFEERRFGSLSGGQAQRAIIARALVSEPKILILDEPTANVDAHAEGLIYSLLRELKGKVTILMVTHDLTAVVNEVDRVFCVQRVGTLLTREQVCQHYAIGVYHPPHQIKGER